MTEVTIKGFRLQLESGSTVDMGYDPTETVEEDEVQRDTYYIAFIHPRGYEATVRISREALDALFILKPHVDALRFNVGLYKGHMKSLGVNEIHKNYGESNGTE